MGISHTVMLVEDDSTMQSVLKTLLELEGYQVVTAAEARDENKILQSIQEVQPDVLFLDVHLHEVNGINVLKDLRQQNGSQAMRVVMSSGMDMKDACLAAGADDFLQKPFMPDELLSKLRGSKSP